MVYIYDSCRNSKTLVPIFYPVMPRYEYCHILFLLVYRIANHNKNLSCSQNDKLY